MEMLRWLKSEGCPWNEGACTSAAWKGPLEALKWLRSEGCPWDGSTWKFAAESVREWLKEMVVLRIIKSTVTSTVRITAETSTAETRLA